MPDTAFPFSAIVGQDSLKDALLISAIDPSLGGVLAFGDRGTGKTTMIRSLAALLPQQSVVKDCQFRCDGDKPAAFCPSCQALSKAGKLTTKKVSPPVIDLPLGATEDRVLGAIDLERALGSGEIVFEAGLLAAAHRGFLYVDEVNLLDDHLVDILLDAAASGVNRIEREGLSLSHAAQFVLIGSGNPEEGELRPQLLDRFGLFVEVTTPRDVAARVEIIKRRRAFDDDREGFAKTWSRKDAALRKRIVTGRENLSSVETSDEMLEKCAELCLALGSDGLRGELSLIRAATGFAALSGRGEVTLEDLRRAAPLALTHRLRKDPLDETKAVARVERAVGEILVS
ncbi:MAG: magnesium chelatase ATPase subunit I [Henriciella sp.]|uniref:magnesium chelatase ATPase subunit I n=1 Tax=Henriciella sp. TaxID=1968823 RepID=UPI003C7206C7